MDHLKCCKEFDIIIYKLYSLEIKEGKTSLKKMVEDYEDERNLLHERFGLKKPDLLP